MSSLKDDPVLAEMAEWLDVEREDECPDEVTLNEIRHKLEVYCFDCPLHYDEAVAQAHGYRTIVAPAVMTGIWTTPAYWTPGEPPPFAPGLRERNGTRREQLPVPYKRGFNAASEWEAYEPLYPGDRMRVTTKLVKIEPKTTRVGTGAFITHENRFIKTTGELVMISRGTAFRYDPDPNVLESARNTPVEQPPATEQPPESDPVVDWSRQIRFGEVLVGDEVPPYHIWLNYQRIVMSVAADRMFSSIHHNREIARDGGLTDIIFNTRGYEMMFEITLRRWMGLDGRIRKMGPFRMVKNSHPGDTITGRAKVTGKEIKDDLGLIQLEIGVDNARGEAARGEVTVSIPV
jgi:acyl dehydratase